MPRRKQFEVQIERSAFEVATLKVSAHSQEEADQLIFDALNKPHRVSLENLVALPAVKKFDTDCNGDDESSWEIC